jgi:hypothetical protein
VDLVDNTLDSGTLELLVDSVREQSVTGSVSYIHDSLFRVCRGLDNSHSLVGGDGVDVGLVLGGEVGQSDDIDLVDDENDRSLHEQWLDRVEEFALFISTRAEIGDSYLPEPRWCNHTAH